MSKAGGGNNSSGTATKTWMGGGSGSDSNGESVAPIRISMSKQLPKSSAKPIAYSIKEGGSDITDENYEYGRG